MGYSYAPTPPRNDVLLFNPHPLKEFVHQTGLNGNARLIHLAAALVYETFLDTRGDRILFEPDVLNSIIYQHYLELVQEGSLPSGIDGQYYELFQRVVHFLFQSYGSAFLAAIGQVNPDFRPSRVVQAGLLEDRHAFLLHAQTK
jgi:hypothetical protein